MTQSILITGGVGFIGSHLAAEYATRGWRVGVLDNRPVTGERNIPGVTYYLCDLRDVSAVRRVISEFSPGVVSHQAALADANYCQVNPTACAEVNVAGTLALLKASMVYGVRRFIFASSAAVYGTVPPHKQIEGLPYCSLRPINCYGESKIASEQDLSLLLGSPPTRIALRYSNVYGPGSLKGVVHAFVKATRERGEVTVFGDGQQTRDFVHVDDVVQAHILACNAALPRRNHVFNVGTGVATSINDLYEMVSSAVPGGLRKRIEHTDTKEARRSQLDTSLSERELGFKAIVKLRDGVRTLMETDRGA